MIGNTAERGVSVAVTHVLTIGITTILIGMLLMGASAMLEFETERSAESSLETIGERLAGEVSNVDRMANKDDDSVAMAADHPRQVANTGYMVTLLPESECSDAPLLTEPTDCLRLVADDHDVTVHVPLVVEADVEKSDATGGPITVAHEDGNISIESERR
ncbi:DUF7266 family protein [Natronobacterium gregoryi]|uniref:Uncharacterized protein n=2 Tax=Natronobacterium gregoryi TaxID=44930 RepID=L0AD43_NATGS|nr:hypothetical protein [Natronobacterium gregoryi]AFZ71761.1 hypothetical protein Natgr_0508 [Natronobacterium gregoryi SP2]ELY72854.1 hypothetical protein C490_02496 [Natronobacterium gregoryi SP2]PLK21058.1 hypothetical protein CYV19_06395 [Natronobacterium gregoryi SP2]SFI88424.1 hypothetical protein SAMN05443661_10862 [Natronobacterium gregoryi]